MSIQAVETIVVGAGVIGLAVARALRAAGREVLLVEQESRWGTGISARNSEVLHAGMYYPAGSLKARLCVRGNALLRAYCRQHHVPLREEGKLVVGWEPSHRLRLEEIQARAACNGGRLGLVGPRAPDAVARLEPHVLCTAALFSPTTGVMDVSTLLHRLFREVEAAGAMVAFQVQVQRLTARAGAWLVEGRDADGSPFALEAQRVINAAGLHSDTLAASAGVDIAAHGLRLRWTKGDYFSIPADVARCVSRPVYPLPTRLGLGTHLTPDVAGQVKLGPDSYYIPRVEDYRVPYSQRTAFFHAVRPFFPVLEPEHLPPAMAGIRPKLQGPDETFRDFHIAEDRPRLINLIGIESPGLTASLALAELIVTRYFGAGASGD